MKLLAVVLVSCFIIYVECVIPKELLSDTIKRKEAEWHDKCKRYTGVAENVIDDMKDGNFPNDESAKRYISCIWTLNGPFDRDYRMDSLKMLDFLHDNHLEDGTEYVRCNQEAINSGAKSFELFWNMQQCIQKSVDSSKYLLF
ncbi:uncharacterized protein LOC130442905 [Diorhabda sublineata]|uniref:uncharacterized protein LOC130442905 n=1 Tax=Diorhabda sublineata TaxID=1163346 RepID=UPI0024E0D523|nr:uncharacterized protein LOC130442905 [Diorhabda sublineata]